MSHTVLEPQSTTPDAVHGRWMCVIYNNDVTPYDLVVVTLMLATGCSQEEANMEAWEAHTFGKSSVHFGTREECEAVAEVMRRIRVESEVCPEWND